MAPSHTLRERINEIVRERLVRDGAVHGPAMNADRLISRGYTNAEKTLAANYAPGDVVAFHRPYKRLGVDNGDERRVLGVDRKAHTVTLQGNGAGRSPGIPTGSRPAPAASRFTAPRRSSSAPGTAYAGPATTWGSGCSTAALRRWRRSPETG